MYVCVCVRVGTATALLQRPVGQSWRHSGAVIDDVSGQTYQWRHAPLNHHVVSRQFSLLIFLFNLKIREFLSISILLVTGRRFRSGAWDGCDMSAVEIQRYKAVPSDISDIWLVVLLCSTIICTVGLQPAVFLYSRKKGATVRPSDRVGVTVRLYGCPLESDVDHVELFRLTLRFFDDVSTAS